MISPFNFSTTPALHFGVGKISVLSPLATSFGPRILLVTGHKSFDSVHGKKILDQFKGLHIERVSIEKEPTPAMVDYVTNKFSSNKPDVVIAIGGGSALDAGKAISAMLPLNEEVKNYLEGVGTKTHPGVKIPFIAVPTTSGTGSEATKNAVLSETGENGYKKSLRHNNFVPDIAVIDPALTVSCSTATSAASGMDAFTQLLESYLSPVSNPITDSLALQGLQLISTSLLKAYHDGENIEARTNMSMAAYLSGITLANAGLGLVHGFASSVGGFFEIPHGVICSSLMSPANKITVRKLRKEKEQSKALEKYMAVGKLFSKRDSKSDEYYIDALLNNIYELAIEMNIPKLSQFGVIKTEFRKIVNATDNKNNPVALTNEEMEEVLETSF